MVTQFVVQHLPAPTQITIQAESTQDRTYAFELVTVWPVTSVDPAPGQQVLSNTYDYGLLEATVVVALAGGSGTVQLHFGAPLDDTSLWSEYVGEAGLGQRLNFLCLQTPSKASGCAPTASSR